MIIDPGSRSFKIMNLSTFYVAFSHVTMLGDESRLNLSIYFTGEHINQESLINITIRQQDGNKALKIQRKINELQNLTKIHMELL